MTTRLRGAGAAFIVLGIVFMTLGFSGQRTYTTIGIVFLILGLVRLARGRRNVP